jgi:hypothetical protein
VLELSENNQTPMEKAEAHFVEKQKRAADRRQASAEYISEAKARAVKTARLRELRLAKEEAERAAGSSEPPKARTERGPRRVKGKTLSSHILIRAGKV